MAIAPTAMRTTSPRAAHPCPQGKLLTLTFPVAPGDPVPRRESTPAPPPHPPRPTPPPPPPSTAHRNGEWSTLYARMRLRHLRKALLSAGTATAILLAMLVGAIGTAGTAQAATSLPCDI